MRFTALKLNSLRDLLIEELRDLYNAETQLGAQDDKVLRQPLIRVAAFPSCKITCCNLTLHAGQAFEPSTIGLCGSAAFPHSKVLYGHYGLFRRPSRTLAQSRHF